MTTADVPGEAPVAAPSAYYAVAAPTAAVPIVLPMRLPAPCFMSAARDYVLPPLVLVAIVKVESNGYSVSRTNSNGTMDHSVAQINTASWGRYMSQRYGISSEALLRSPCQAVRVMAYALRSEMNTAECQGVDVWCSVGRYHSPNNMANRAVYVPKVQKAVTDLLETGKF